MIRIEAFSIFHKLTNNFWVDLIFSKMELNNHWLLFVLGVHHNRLIYMPIIIRITIILNISLCLTLLKTVYINIKLYMSLKLRKIEHFFELYL